MDFYKSIIESSPAGYAYHKIILDANNSPCDYEFIEVNASFENFTGLKRSDILSKNISEVLPDIKKSEFNWIKFYGNIAISGGSEEFEQFSEPLKRWYKVKVYSPEKFYFITHFIDITKEKSQIDELKNLNIDRELQKNYGEMLLKTVPSAVFTVDNECRITSWNKRAESMTGYTSEEVLGKDCTLFALEPCRTKCGLVSNDVKKPVTCKVCTIKNKIGNILTISKNVDVLRDSQGNVIGGIECFEDITDRIETESIRIRQAGLITSLLDSIPDIIFFKDTEGIYLGCNPPFAEFVGKSREHIIGKTDYELFDKEIADFFRHNDNEMLKQKLSRHNEEWITYPDGRKILIDTIKTPYWDNDGSLIGILGISRDITERKQIEEKLKESEINFRTFFNSIDDFLFVLDEQGNMVNVNDTVTRRLGYLEDELIGENVLMVHPKDRRDEAGRIVGEMLAGATEFCPVPIITKSGQLIQVETRVYSGVWNGKPALFGVTKDITKIKQTEERFSKAFQAGSSLMAISEIESGLFIDVNESFLKTTGYLKDEVIGKSAIELSLFDNAEDRAKVLGIVKETGFAKDIEVKIKVKHGEPRIGLFSVSMMDIGGKSCWLTTMTDITERKQLEKVLQESEKRFNLALNGTGAGLWDWDMVDDSVYFSPQWKAMLGYEDHEIENAFTGWKKLWHPDDAVRIEKALNDHLAGKTIKYEIEHRLRHKDGEWRWILTRGDIHKDATGKPYRWVGTNIDLSKMKNIEEELQRNNARHLAMIENIGDVIGIMGVDGIMKYKSPNIERYFGWKPEDLVGTDGWETVHPEDIERIQKEFYFLLQTDNVSTTVEYRYKCKDGTFKWISLTAVNGINNSYINGVLLNYHDISERKQVEVALLKAKEQAEIANASKSQFLANMSHEIRTPMNGIFGFLELLQTSNLSSEQKEFIREAKSASTVLLNLINDILDFSKIEAGKLTMEKISFNLRTAVEDAISLLVPKAAEKNLELHVMIKAGVPEEVIGDPSRLRQILSNLFSNAVKFTENGEVSVIVDYLEKENEIAMLKFEVKDSGIGISKEAIDKLFQSFNQADASTTRKYGGTGLGLAICKELVKMMDGEISVESIPGEGSTFSFNVCLEIAKRAVEQKIEYEKLDGVNILIVDDNASNRKIVSSYLQGTGLKVFEAKDAGNAITTIISNASTKNKISIAIIDYQMPGMSGYDLAAALKNIPLAQDIKLMLLTSASQKGDGRTAQENGFSGYLSKPVRKDDLINCIAIVLGLKKEVDADDQVVTKYTVKEVKNALKPRILLVEDNEINRKVVLGMLKSHDMTCDVALDGVEALKAVAEKDYDVVFMDCQMPIMDGYESTSKIREIEGDKKHTTIIAMTANAMEGDKAKCIDAGMDDYISKPIDYDNMFKLIAANTKYQEQSLEHFDLINENIDRFVDSTGIKKDDAEELFGDYISYLPDLLKGIKDSIENSDFEQMGKLAHQLKGSSGNLRITSIYQLAIKLEEATMKQEKEECERLFKELQEMFH